MKLSVFLVGAIAAVAVNVNALPASNPNDDNHNQVVHERRDTLPVHWTEERRLHKKTSLPVRIGLVQSNADIADHLLMEVSDYTSPRYGKYYTAEQVHDIFAPSKESVDAVRQWLEDAGISPERITQSVNKQWIQFDGDAEEVEKLLHAEYRVYSHRITGRSHVACREYSVPKSVREHIDYITPGIKLLEVNGVRQAKNQKKDLVSRNSKRTQGFSTPRPPLVRPLDVPIHELLAAPPNASICDSHVTPACIKEMYQIPPGTKSTPGNELGIFEDLGDVYSQQDLDLFFSTLYPSIPNGTHPVHNLIDGAVAPVPVDQAGPESDLDFQISYPIIWPQNSVLFQTDDPVYEANYTFEGFLNNFLDAIDGSYCSFSSSLDPQYPDPSPGGYNASRQCGVYEPTNVISISYGGAESDLPISYQRRQCLEWLKLGLRGISVLVSSGDSGVEGSRGDPTPSNCLGENHNIFVPQFPATCPYLTAVGATYLPPGADPKADTEVAVTRFPSGGGFSNIFLQPAYQLDAVHDYFRDSDPGYPFYASVDNSSFGANGGIYNRIGRAYPDVAAIGDNVVIFNQGQAVRIGGTSASAPAFAGILTRINEERIAANKPTVGFVNPVLYRHPEVFRDVTVGNNSGCGTPGFFAAKGWDPVTGLGTPVYPKLLDLFMGV